MLESTLGQALISDLMKKFQIYINPHCHDCDAVIEAMQDVVKCRGGAEAEIINVLDDVDAAVALRITRVPALVKGHQVIVQGTITEGQLKERLEQYLATGDAGHD